jgi:hypothetical protein
MTRIELLNGHDGDSLPQPACEVHDECYLLDLAHCDQIDVCTVDFGSGCEETDMCTVDF